jgi:two-component system cell cycle response regulator
MQIVLADASRITLRMLTTMLEARGHVVHPMTDGAEALKFISDNVEIDALITSIELTSLTGFELSWEVRLLSVARHRPLYIIVMSSSSDEKTISEALDSGADDFIRKPPSATALYARLRAAERLIGSETELIRLADRDPLTELLNRRAFFMGCKHAIDRAQVGRLSAIMADIDHFKQVNDRYGHDVGDQVIRAVAHEASLMSKLVGRLGGEEFAILLEGEPAETDFELAEGLRAKCSQIKFEFGTQSLAITCSLGVARWAPDTTIDELLRSADSALYEAKRGGRNQVVCAKVPSGPDPTAWSGLVRTPGRAAVPMSAGGREDALRAG